MKPEIDFAGRAYLGTRQTQQDYYAFWPVFGDEHDSQKILMVLADGMGGGADGAEASRMAVEAFIEAFQMFTGSIESNDGMALRESLDAANRSMLLLKDAGTGESGTTLVAATITSSLLQWISVGDSALFLLRGNRLERLNADHSMRPVVEARVAAGELTAHESATVSGRNHLRSALTGTELDLIDFSPKPFRLRPGDTILCATDGMECVDPREIVKISVETRNSGAAETAQRLISCVKNLERRGQDNATIAIVIP